MTKEELKNELGLTDEAVEMVYKNFVPKSQFNAKNNEVKTLKEKVAELEEDNQATKAQREQLEREQAEAKAKEGEYQKQLELAQIEREVSMAILTKKGRNEKAIRALMDMDSIKVEDGKVLNVAEEVQKVFENADYLFESATPSINGIKPATPPAETSATITKADFARMSYTEREKLYNENKELYEELEQGE